MRFPGIIVIAAVMIGSFETKYACGSETLGGPSRVASDSMRTCMIGSIANSKDQARIQKLLELLEANDSERFYSQANLSIMSRHVQFEIAKIAAAQDGARVSVHFKTYGKLTQAQRFEIAKIAAAKSGSRVSVHLENYGKLTQTQRFEIAKIAAAQDGWGVSQHFKNYGKLTQTQRFEIAKIAAAQDGWGVSEYFKNYGKLTQAQRFEIVKIAAAQNGNRVSKNFKNYGKMTQTQRFEIAKIAAAQNGWGVSEHLKNYGRFTQAQIFEIAKIAAAGNGAGVSEHFKNYGNLTQAQRFKIVKIAAAQNGARVSEHFKNYGRFTQAQYFEIAKIAAAQDGAGVSMHFKNYGKFSQAQRLEIVKIAAAQNGAGVSEHFKNYGRFTQEQRLKIVKIAAAQNGTRVSEHFKNYGKLTQAQRFEIAKIAAAQDGWGVSEHFKNYGKLTQAQRFEIVKIAAIQSGAGVSEHFKNYGKFTQAQRFEIIKIAAAQDGARVSEHFKNYGKLTQAQRFEIAKIAAAQNGWGVSYDLENYGRFTQAQRFEIAKIAAAQDGWGVSEHFKNYGRFTQAQRIQIIEIASFSSETALHRQKRLNRTLRLYDQQIHGNLKLRKFLAEQVKEGTEIDIELLPYHKARDLFFKESNFPKTWKRALSKGPKDTSWFLNMIQAYYRSEYLKLSDVGNLSSRPRAAEWHELLLDAIGLDRSQISLKAAKSLAKNPEFKVFTDLWTDLFSSFPKSDLSQLALDLPIESKTLGQWNEMLSALRDYSNLNVADLESSGQVFDQLVARIGSLSTNSEKIKEIKKLTEASLEKLFNKPNWKLRYHDLQELKKRWGGIESVLILLSRFQKNPKWKTQMDDLLDVFDASLKNRFHDSKFGRLQEEGVRVKRAQIRSLKTPSQLKAWMKPRAFIKKIKLSDEAALLKTQIEGARNLVRDGLAHDMGIAVSRETEYSSLFGKLINDWDTFSESPRKWVKKELGSKNDQKSLDESKKIVSLILGKLTQSDDQAEIQSLVTGLNRWVNEEPSLVPHNQLNQVKRHFKSIQGKFKQRKPKSNQNQFILSVLSSDPKFLLEIGDLVKTSSCQSYKNGSHAETLLSYVKDANIQAMASFALSESHFFNPSDFAQVQKALEQGSVSVSFDGNQRIASFTFHDGTRSRRIQSQPLGYAYLRNLLRLGETADGSSGLILEPDYSQVHDGLVQMKAQHQDLLTEIAEEIKAKIDQTVTFQPSSNSSGTYTDLGGGVQKGEYSASPR